MLRLENVYCPEERVELEVPIRVPVPVFIATDVVEVLSVVTILPLASRALTTILKVDVETTDVLDSTAVI